MGSRSKQGIAALGLYGSAALAISIPLPVVAQAAQIDREAQRIQEQQQQQARDRAEQFDRSQSRAPTGKEVRSPDTAGPDGGGCAAIKSVRLVGASRYPLKSFSAILDPLRGSCVGIAAIDAGLRAITDRYVHDGFVTTRAFVGPQDLKSGALTITVIEGQVGGFKGAGDGRSYGTGEMEAAFPARPGDRLNLRALEQGVDQLARLAKGDPKIDIAPGDVPGTSLVLVDRQPLSRWIRPSITINDQGAANTGRWQASAGLEIDSLLGVADSWSLYYQGNASPDRERRAYAYGGFLSLPQGWWTVSMSAGASGYRSVLEGNGLRFTASGRTLTGSATLDRMVFRDAQTKLSLSAGLSLLDTRNLVHGITLRSGSYRIVTGDVGIRWQRRVAKTQLSVSGSYDQGLGALGAHTVDTGPGGATGRFHRLRLDTMAQTPFEIGKSRMTNVFVLRGQWSLDNVFPADRFSLGGPSTVRGFRDDGISGRTGIAFRDQLGIGLIDLGKAYPELATAVSAYLAYDVGAIRPVRGDPFERGSLQSLSAGLMARGRHVQAEFTLAVPLSAPVWVRHSPTLFSTNIRITL